jgi:fatty acid desaturase
VASGIGWVRARGERAGLRTGPVGSWTAAHKTLLRAVAVAVAALIFVFWGQPTVAVVIWLVVLLLVVLGIIELLSGRPAHSSAAPGD